MTAWEVDDVERIMSTGLSGAATARVFGMTIDALRWRMGRLRQASNITDVELDAVVRWIVSENELTGERMLIGRLRARGIMVSRQRVRDSVSRVDAAGAALRRRRRLRRRVYFVPYCNFLWHIDGWHKLRR